MPCMGRSLLFDVSGLTGRWKRSRRNGLERSGPVLGCDSYPRQLGCNVILPLRVYKLPRGERVGMDHHFIRQQMMRHFATAGFA